MGVGGWGPRDGGGGAGAVMRGDWPLGPPPGGGGGAFRGIVADIDMLG